MAYKKEFKKKILAHVRGEATWQEAAEEFGVSQMSISRWLKEFNSGKKEKGLDPFIKQKMKEIFDEMWDSLSASKQKEIMGKYEQDIPKIMEVFE